LAHSANGVRGANATFLLATRREQSLHAEVAVDLAIGEKTGAALELSH
jgi:hypothetical protein